MSGFGKANIETQFDGFKYFKLRTPDPKKGETETSLVLRLLPSMKSYRDTGEWKFFYGQHYGYAGVNSRDPSKPRSRPFGCIQKKGKNKEIITPCPKCTQMSKMEDRRKAREDELAKQHGFEGEEARKSSEFYEIKKSDSKYSQLAAWLSKHNCDKKFWINVMSKDGEYGVLQLSYSTTQEKLIPLLKKLADGTETGEKVDAFDPGSGMWLNFTRSGRIPRVVDNVVPFTELVDVGNGKKAKMAATAPMTQEQIEKALKVCPDLAKDVVKFIEATTIQQLVDCSGDPEEVDRIWPPENKQVKPTAPATTTTSGDEGSVDEGESLVDVGLTPAKAEVKTQVTEEPKVETKSEPAPAAEEDDEEAALQRQLEAARAKKAAKLAAASTAASTTTTSAMGKSVDNPDDFLAQFNAK
jgi:hypothetical protein